MSITISLSGNNSILEGQYCPPIIVGKGATLGLVSLHSSNSILNIAENNDIFCIGDIHFKLKHGIYELEDIINEITSKLITQKISNFILLKVVQNFRDKKKPPELFNVYGMNQTILYEKGIEIIDENESFDFNSLQQNHFFIYEAMNLLFSFKNGNMQIKKVNEYANQAIYEYLNTDRKNSKLVQVPNRAFIPKKLTLAINVNEKTLKCEIKSNRIIDFSSSNSIANVFGFKNRILEENKRHNSDSIIRITSMNNVQVHCNLISGSYQNDRNAYIIHEFAVGVPSGYKFSEIPRNVIYYPMTVEEITSITIKLTNQKGELLYMNEEDVSIRLHIISKNAAL